ncbi:predicted protein [Plenodomus lingam JN3]|uniref:Predicted protein n=1 Tax=Leptosphaeria maculans (strain JN3 / isolate v23.1.3 / race Av1-4-5-6-7-8) TaxID=985895 RepID=E4ZN12_LEPMJ|nr:predicted protein [Plenodomus lingam JN3]CBX92615.1 predicted protein [Plenodomus lingam JN3]
MRLSTTVLTITLFTLALSLPVPQANSNALTLSTPNTDPAPAPTAISSCSRCTTLYNICMNVKYPPWYPMVAVQEHAVADL